MQTLIIHDNEGYILNTHWVGQPSPREPIGVPFLWVTIPEGKQIKRVNGIGVDVTKTPHEVILEDIPPTEVDILRDDLNGAIMELSMLVAMGGMPNV